MNKEHKWGPIRCCPPINVFWDRKHRMCQNRQNWIDGRLSSSFNDTKSRWISVQVENIFLDVNVPSKRCSPSSGSYMDSFRCSWQNWYSKRPLRWPSIHESRSTAQKFTKSQGIGSRLIECKLNLQGLKADVLHLILRDHGLRVVFGHYT